MHAPPIRRTVHTMRTLLASMVLGLLFVLTACGGEDITHPPRADDLAWELDCDGFALDEDPDFGTQESGTCTLDGADIFIDTYASKKTLEANLKVGQELADAGLDGGAILVRGDQWLVEVYDSFAAETVVDVLDGEIVD